MRGLLYCCVAAGCHFTVADGGDASIPDDAAVKTDIGSDHPADSATSCGGKVWFTGFDTDPTTADDNGDGITDWRLRDGSPFPTSQLVNGRWHPPGPTAALDTQPKQTFSTRAVVDMRMRSLSPNGPHGAVFWINVGYDAVGTYAPLYVDVARQQNGSQALTIFTKTTAGADSPLATTTGLPADLVDIHLDIDPSLLRVNYLAAGVTGTATLVRQLPSAQMDQWATILAWGGESEIDSLRVEVCP